MHAVVIPDGDAAHREDNIGGGEGGAQAAHDGFVAVGGAREHEGDGPRFADVSREPMSAARKVLAYVQAGGRPGELIDAARRLVFLKGDDPHDYKFSSAVLEDYYHASPAWRDRYLATSVFRLCGSQAPDNDLVQRTRAAVQA